jgi:hypothetical protein
MSYLMQHPEHGFNNVYTPEEVEAQMKNGWTVFRNHPNPAFRVFDVPPSIDAQPEGVKRPRGRPKAIQGEEEGVV